MKKNLKVFRLIVLGLLFALGVYSCENEDISIGNDVLNTVAIKSKSLIIDITTTNNIPEEIRSDRSSILMNLGDGVTSDKATIGVYNEPIFGKTKSDFYSQVRLSQLNPQFGAEAKIDSIILSLPAVAFSKDTLSKSERLLETKYTLKKKDNKCEITDTTYVYEKKFLMRVDSIYGNPSAKMNIQVHKVTENMGDINTKIYSNKTFQIGDLLGEKEITNTAYIKKIVSSEKEDSNDKSIKVVSEETTPNFRIRLKNLEDLFQKEVINKKAYTGDQITFINNVLKGIKISTNSDNGFILTFAPNGARLTMYYTYNNPNFTDKNNNEIQDDEESCPVVVTKKRLNDSYSFFVGAKGSGNEENIAASYNVFQNHIENTGANIASTEGKIYLSGMGGNSVLLELNKEQIQKLRDNVTKKHWAITNASFKIYVDTDSQGSLPIPQFLHVYNKTQNKLIPDYGAVRESGFRGFPFFTISEPYRKGYYELRVTQFIKNIVEKNEPIDNLILKMGNYINLKNAYFYNPPFYNYSNNIYNPYRLVAFGGSNKVDASKRLQLEITYSEK